MSIVIFARLQIEDSSRSILREYQLAGKQWDAPLPAGHSVMR